MVRALQQYGTYVAGIKGTDFQSGNAADYTNTDAIAGNAITRLALDVAATAAEKVFEGIEHGCDEGEGSYTISATCHDILVMPPSYGVVLDIFHKEIVADQMHCWCL